METGGGRGFEAAVVERHLAIGNVKRDHGSAT